MLDAPVVFHAYGGLPASDQLVKSDYYVVRPVGHCDNLRG